MPLATSHYLPMLSNLRLPIANQLLETFTLTVFGNFLLYWASFQQLICRLLALSFHFFVIIIFPKNRICLFIFFLELRIWPLPPINIFSPKQRTVVILKKSLPRQGFWAILPYVLTCTVFLNALFRETSPERFCRFWQSARHIYLFHRFRNIIFFVPCVYLHCFS